MPASDILELFERRGHEVVLRPLDTSETPERIAKRFRFPGLVSVRATEEFVIVRLKSPKAVAQFDLDFAVLDGGSHKLADRGLVLEPRSGRGTAVLELVPAPPEQHWRMLNGGHVDIVPHLRQHETAKLSQLSTVEIIELPSTGFVTLVFGHRSSATAPAVINKLDVDALAKAVCGTDCRASLPIELDPTTNNNQLPRTLELNYLAGADAEAIGARIIAHQLLDHDIDVHLVPLEFDEYRRRGPAGEFELLLMVAPASPKAFPKFLELMGVTPAEVANRLIPLWNNKLYAAYDTSICNVEPDSVTSWRWLAKVRPCEEGER